MTRFRVCALSMALCTLFVVGHCSDVTTEKPEIIKVVPYHPNTTSITTTTTSTTSTTTTPKPTPTPSPTPTTSTTTTSTSTTTTPTSTTTTSTSTTTTPTSTTTTPTSTTTTPKPTPPPTPTPPPKPTPTPAPTPAPKPAPLPTPDQGTWFYPIAANETCIVIQFAAQLNVTYPKAVGKASVFADVLLNVPSNATVTSGLCGNANSTEQWLKLSWKASNTTTPNNMTFVFQRNDTTHNYALKWLNVSLTTELFPNATSPNPMALSHGVEWQTPVATSYRCAAPTRLNMTSDSGAIATVTMSRLQEEAFKSSGNRAFSAARECGGGDVPDAVPIAVGCALGGLVVVVLIAYLVGRRRSAARGYLSM